MSKVNTVIGMSAELKEALATYAQAQKASINHVVRKAIANAIGYDLSQESKNKIERRGRPRIYKSDDERKAAVAQKAKEKRAEAKRFVEQYRRQQTRRDMNKFRETVERELGPIV